MENENSESEKRAEREAPELESSRNKIVQKTDKQTKMGTPDLDENSKLNIAELEEIEASELEGDASDLERRIWKNTSELKKRMQRNSSKLKSRKEDSDAEKGTEINASELERRTESNASELAVKTKGFALEKETLRVDVELERAARDGGIELEKRMGSDVSESEKRASELEKRNETLELNSHGKGNIPDETIERVDETNVPLLVGDSVSIEMKRGPESKPTVHVHAKAKKSKEAAAKKKESLHPIQRMRSAWNTSSNVCSFFLRAVLIIFTTLGWMMCAGGIPFVSIAMIVIGSLYFDDCNVQPNIPLYLVVSGVCGTLQHVIAFWNKYLPEESQGRLRVYRRYYSLLDGAMTCFLFIWFILGCVWVYGVNEVDFIDDYKDEYCHKTLYYFAFWLLNISFIIIAMVMVLGLCAILCIVALPKDEAVV